MKIGVNRRYIAMTASVGAAAIALALLVGVPELRSDSDSIQSPDLGEFGGGGAPPPDLLAALGSVPEYPDAVVDQYGASTGSDVIRTYRTTSTPDAVMRFYEEALSGDGWSFLGPRRFTAGGLVHIDPPPIPDPEPAQPVDAPEPGDPAASPSAPPSFPGLDLEPKLLKPSIVREFEKGNLVLGLLVRGDKDVDGRPEMTAIHLTLVRKE